MNHKALLSPPHRTQNKKKTKNNSQPVARPLLRANPRDRRGGFGWRGEGKNFNQRSERARPVASRGAQASARGLEGNDCQLIRGESLPRPWNCDHKEALLDSSTMA